MRDKHLGLFVVFFQSYYFQIILIRGCLRLRFDLQLCVQFLGHIHFETIALAIEQEKKE